MRAKELLQSAMSSSGMVLPLLLDMKDDPLATPMPDGGNHAMWIMGHLAFSEGWMFWDCMRGEANPVSELAALFGIGSKPVSDLSVYPAFDELLEKFQQLRNESLALLNTLDDDDLDRKSANPPPGMENVFGTWGKCYLMSGMHWMNHRGQIADVRRAAGRAPVTA